MRILGASMSSKYHETMYPAAAAIDGDIRSIAATARQTNAWLSVRLPPDTEVRYIVIYNRPDNPEYQEWLSPYEVWVGSSHGDSTEKAARCGGPALISPPASGPFTVACGEQPVRGEYVTLKQVGKARWLNIAELAVYSSPTASSLAGLPVAVSSPMLSSLTMANGQTHHPKEIHCHPGSSKIDHLSAPHVVPLSCASLVLELPPLPPDHGCDSDPNQRLAIEVRSEGRQWVEARQNVLSAAVIIGNLLPTRAYEFRMVLRRPALGHLYSESSGLVVTEDGAANATIRTAPTISHHQAPQGGAYLVVSWDGGKACRAGEPVTLEVSDATGETTERQWQMVTGNWSGGDITLQADLHALRVCTEWCRFRIAPEGVLGWHEATEPSLQVKFNDDSVRATHGSIMLMVLLLVPLLLAIYRTACQLLAEGRVDAKALQDEMMLDLSVTWASLNAGWLAILENTRWLSNAWASGLGSPPGGLTGEEEEELPLTLEEENVRPPQELGKDDFAPPVPPLSLASLLASIEQEGLDEEGDEEVCVL